jgi:hypothetical protein
MNMREKGGSVHRISTGDAFCVRRDQMAGLRDRFTPMNRHF